MLPTTAIPRCGRDNGAGSDHSRCTDSQDSVRMFAYHLCETALVCRVLDPRRFRAGPQRARDAATGGSSSGIVVELPFRSHPVCLPVLFRLWRGKGTPSPVRLAGEMISVLRQQFPERTIHGVGDAAYHGKVLLVENTTFTTRLPVNAVLYAPAPPRTGKRGRPRLKGQRLGIPAELATTADWRPGHGVALRPPRYRRRPPETAALWYGAFGTQPALVETAEIVRVRRVSVGGSKNGQANRAGGPVIRRRCRCRTPIRCRVQEAKLSSAS